MAAAIAQGQVMQDAMPHKFRDDSRGKPAALQVPRMLPLELSHMLPLPFSLQLKLGYFDQHAPSIAGSQQLHLVDV